MQRERERGGGGDWGAERERGGGRERVEERGGDRDRQIDATETYRKGEGVRE